MHKIESRDEARVAPLDNVVRVVSVVAGLTWPVPAADVPALITRLGWTPADPLTATTFAAESGWELNRTDCSLSCDNGELTSVDFRVTDVVREPYPWRADFLNDAFVDVVAAITGFLGRPSKTVKSAKPDVFWDLANGGSISVHRIESSVFAVVDSAEWAEVNRKLGD